MNLQIAVSLRSQKNHFGRNHRERSKDDRLCHACSRQFHRHHWKWKPNNGYPTVPSLIRPQRQQATEILFFSYQELDFTFNQQHRVLGFFQFVFYLLKQMKPIDSLWKNRDGYAGYCRQQPRPHSLQWQARAIMMSISPFYLVFVYMLPSNLWKTSDFLCRRLSFLAENWKRYITVKHSALNDSIMHRLRISHCQFAHLRFPDWWHNDCDEKINISTCPFTNNRIHLPPWT